VILETSTVRYDWTYVFECIYEQSLDWGRICDRFLGEWDGSFG